jgi:CO dehydrogenase/acetyl-CoA synthase delta subunit
VTFLKRNWRTVLLAVIVALTAALSGNKLVTALAPVATDVVNAIPCTPGEVSEKCPAPPPAPTPAR